VVSEARGLFRLAGVAEVIPERSNPRLRVVTSAVGDRRIALFDYGPRGGAPAFIFHAGLIGGAELPTPYVRELQARGLRPIAPQRPGFGLTDAAEGDYLAAAVADLATIHERLGLGPVLVVGRANGAAVAVEYAARHPEQVRCGVLINPLTPRGFEQTAPGIFTAVSRTLLRHPRLSGPMLELMRRQSRSDLVERNLHRAFDSVAADRECLGDPKQRESLVRDSQALFARSSAGLTAEMAVFGRGWRPPPTMTGGSWRIVHLGGMDCEPVFDPWRGLPGAELVILEGAGYLADRTHSAALAAAVAAAMA